jgi:hypothetical protein
MAVVAFLAGQGDQTATQCPWDDMLDSEPVIALGV